MLPALNQTSAQQAQSIENVMKKNQRLLDYANTYSNTAIRLYVSDMQLLPDSDAVYFGLPKSRSQIAGYYRFADTLSSSIHYTDNEAILIECYTLQHIVSSAVDAKTNIALFK